MHLLNTTLYYVVGSPGDTLVSVNEETVQSESSSDPGSLSSSQPCLAGASVQQNRKSAAIYPS